MENDENYEPQTQPIVMDLKTLRALGLDTRTIQDGIVSGAIDMIVKDCRAQIVETVHARVSAVINAEVNKLVHDAFIGNRYQPVTSWGEPKGEPTTIKNEIEKSISEWWKQRVDDKGEPSGYSSARPRATWIAQNVALEVLNGSLKAETAKLVGETRDLIKAGVSKAVTDTLEQLWTRSLK